MAGREADLLGNRTHRGRPHPLGDADMMPPLDYDPGYSPEDTDGKPDYPSMTGFSICGVLAVIFWAWVAWIFFG